MHSTNVHVDLIFLRLRWLAAWTHTQADIRRRSDSNRIARRWSRSWRRWSATSWCSSTARRTSSRRASSTTATASARDSLRQCWHMSCAPFGKRVWSWRLDISRESPLSWFRRDITHGCSAQTNATRLTDCLIIIIIIVQKDHLSIPAVISGFAKGECGLVSEHVHSWLTCCNQLSTFLNFHIYYLWLCARWP